MIKTQLSMPFILICLLLFSVSVRAGGGDRGTQTKESIAGSFTHQNYYALQQTLSTLEYSGCLFSSDKYYEPVICYSLSDDLRLRVHFSTTLEKFVLSTIPVNDVNFSLLGDQQNRMRDMNHVILVLLRQQCPGEAMRQARENLVVGDLVVGNKEGLYKSEKGVSWIYARVEAGVVNFVVDPLPCEVDSPLQEDELMASINDQEKVLTPGELCPKIRWQSEQEPVCRAVVCVNIDMSSGVAEQSAQLVLIFIEVDYADLRFTVGAAELERRAPWHLRDAYHNRKSHAIRPLSQRYK